MIVLFGALLLALRADRVTNINIFSLHSLYRNRLIRGYLGASNEDRKPNPFTGFDPTDNMKMHELRFANGAWDNDPEIRRPPLHVINIALNLVSGTNMAWQQRKAMSFTVTPLHCGASMMHNAVTKEAGVFRDAKYYGGQEDLFRHPTGISLGTAMAISGAAVSSNMGYHTSPLLAFLLTMFNARLGYWLGNPAYEYFNLNGPPYSLKPLLQELFGLTDDKRDFVNLSDGGHFENLGIYEMVLRRCHFILACDATCDGRTSFEDLANAVRKIRIDLGINIEFPQGLQSINNPQTDPDTPHAALGIIHYEAVDGPAARNGILLYIKASLCQKEPNDVATFHMLHPDFPHDSTANQFFDEERFESYRRLGFHAIECCFDTKASLPDFEVSMNGMGRKTVRNVVTFW